MLIEDQISRLLGVSGRVVIGEKEGLRLLREAEKEIRRLRKQVPRSFRSGWHLALDNIINHGADPIEMDKLFQELKED